MRAGKIASVLVAVALAAVAAGVYFITCQLQNTGLLENPHQSATTGALALFGISVVVFTAVILPVVSVCDGALQRLRSYIDSAGTDDKTASPDVISKWLQPVSRAFIGAVDRFQQREQNLKHQLRDLEIRHRVSESQRRQIEAVLHSLRDPVVVTDAYGEILMANEVAAQTFDFKVAEAMHKPVTEVISNRRLCQLIMGAREHANFNERRHVEHELETAEGEKRAYDICLSCVENHKHEVGGVVAILHDLTREREVSQMKSDFVSKASHELRTPLSSIRAYVEMLVDGEAQDEASRQEFCRIIHAETDRLGRLIDNMLNISRIEAGIVQIERENVNLQKIIHRAIGTIEPQARERKINVHDKLAPVDLTVEGDGDMIYQVVLNLLSNAVKYTPEGGRVTVSADSDNLTRSVLVCVSDTGLGIPPDSMPKLFDKFYRVENYKRVAKGTGLGLSLCKHIVETLHHGQIGVESQLGMGSKFWFSVPMRYAGSSLAA